MTGVHLASRKAVELCGAVMSTRVVRVRDNWLHNPVCYRPADHVGMHEARDGYVYWGGPGRLSHSEGRVN